jgi:hypothetical protein
VALRRRETKRELSPLGITDGARRPHASAQSRRLTPLVVDVAAPGPGRYAARAVHETEKERLNRNLDQLLQELRVVLPGVQVLFAFLLAVPFASRFKLVDWFDRVVFFAALLFASFTMVLLLAPSIQHRILFRQDQKRYLVQTGTTLAVAGMTALACSITLSLVLVAHFLYGTWAAAIVAGTAIIAIATIWYAIPIEHRRGAGTAIDNLDEEPPPRTLALRHRDADDS